MVAKGAGIAGPYFRHLFGRLRDIYYFCETNQYKPLISTETMKKIFLFAAVAALMTACSGSEGTNAANDESVADGVDNMEVIEESADEFEEHVTGDATLDEAVEQANDILDKATETAANMRDEAVEKAKEIHGQAVEKAKDAVDKVKDHKEKLEKMKDKADELMKNL